MNNLHPAMQVALAPFAPPSQPVQPELDVRGEADLQYRLGDVLLDVWTSEYKGQATIEGVAVAGTRIDIVSMLSDAQVKSIREHCELNLPTRAQVLSDAAEENRDAMRAEARAA